MKLIVGLWNPGIKYNNTRHNIWFMFLDFFAWKNWFSDFKLESKFKSEISNWLLDWEKTILLKPQTYMNLSWESLRKIVDFYKINIQDIVIIYDDMSMDFWKIRTRDKWSAGWHNWIKSIITHFSQDFKRIKIWVWFNENYEVSDWVLSKFTLDELDELDEKIFNEVEKKLINLI